MKQAVKISKAEVTIEDLRKQLADKDAQIARLKAELIEAQDQLPFVSEVCGDDLWEL